MKGWGRSHSWCGGGRTRTPDPGSGHTPPRDWQGEQCVLTQMDGGPHKIYSMVNMYRMLTNMLGQKTKIKSLLNYEISIKLAGGSHVT